MSASGATVIHESAFVDDGAAIGAGTRIWHFCHVMPGAVIGDMARDMRTQAIVLAHTRRTPEAPRV